MKRAILAVMMMGVLAAPVYADGVLVPPVNDNADCDLSPSDNQCKEPEDDAEKLDELFGEFGTTVGKPFQDISKEVHKIFDKIHF